MHNVISTNHVFQVFVEKIVAITQHLTIDPHLTVGDRLGHTFVVLLLLFGLYIVLLLLASAVWFRSHNPFGRRMDALIDRELNAMGKIGDWFVNYYWLVGCLFLKRWWQSRKLYSMSSKYGMSWEGKEKEYLMRYAASK